MKKKIFITSERLEGLRDYNEIFRKDVTYDNIKSYQKPGLHLLSEKHIYRKTTGGGGGQIELPSLARLFRVKVTSPKIVREMFQFRDAATYKLIKQTDFQTTFVHSACSGTQSIKFIGQKIWEIWIHEIKQLEGPQESKKTINHRIKHHVHENYVKLIYVDLVLFDIGSHTKEVLKL